MLVFGGEKISPHECLRCRSGNQTKKPRLVDSKPMGHSRSVHLTTPEFSPQLWTEGKKSFWNTSKWSLRKSVLKNKLPHNGRWQILWLSGRWYKIHYRQRDSFLGWNDVNETQSQLAEYHMQAPLTDRFGQSISKTKPDPYILQFIFWSLSDSC